DADVMNMLNDAEKSVFKCISLEKVDIDTVIASTGFKAAEVLSILLNLELRGLIEQRPGKMYVRKE
ncbi:MAG: DNA-protecting protein DprA, partial [Deltaproteobacteria bacterium]|nr:DNA-protecting protein DprA [Deltaproteobacteria bacterium]